MLLGGQSLKRHAPRSRKRAVSPGHPFPSRRCLGRVAGAKLGLGYGAVWKRNYYLLSFNRERDESPLGRRDRERDLLRSDFGRSENATWRIPLVSSGSSGECEAARSAAEGEKPKKCRGTGSRHRCAIESCGPERWPAVVAAGENSTMRGKEPLKSGAARISASTGTTELSTGKSRNAGRIRS